MRGVAILMVFGFHLLGASFGYDRLPWEGLFPSSPNSRSFFLLYPLSYGSAGVAVFFVISGFCIHLNYARSRPSGWGAFFVRRFFRIYPPYLAAVLLFFLFWGWYRREDAGRQLFTHVIGFHNLDGLTAFGINPAFWSIGVEIQLYLLFPILIALVAQWGWSPALWLTALAEGGLRMAGAIQAWIGGEALPMWLSLSPFAFWFSWALGAHLAECFLRGGESWLAKTPAPFFLFFALAGSWFKPLEAFQFTAWALLTAVAVQRFMVQRWNLPSGGWSCAVWQHLGSLGIVSYSFYLLHQPVMNKTWPLAEMVFPGADIHPLFRAVLCLFWYPILFLASKAFFIVLEKPSIEMGKRLLGRKN